MTLHDALGNELNATDMVLIQLPLGDLIMGYVAKITDTEVTFGFISSTVAVADRLPNIFKVQQPIKKEPQ